MRRTLIAFVTLAAVIGLGGKGAAQDIAGPIPGLPWVHQGTVITSRWYAANLFRQGLTVTQDDNGQWMGSDGQNYSSSVHQAMDAGGLTQTTVLAIDGDQVAVKITKYTASGFGGDPARSSPNHGGEPRFIAPADKNTFCEAPNLLAKEASDAQSGRLVREVTWPMGDQKVGAIRIDKKTASEWTTVVYDRKTGIRLHLASVSSTGSDTGTILMEYDLVGYRDLNVPWSGERVPQAVKNMKSMRLSGQIVQESALAVRSSSATLELTMDRCTNEWASANAGGTVTLPGYGQKASSLRELRYYGPAEFGGLWIGPVAAGKLYQGQVLDEDPNTKMKTVVSRVDDQEIEITQSNTATSVQSVYERSTGLLVGSGWFDSLTRFRTAMRRDDLQ